VIPGWNAAAQELSSLGEVYETRYGLTTPQRIYGTVEENRAGHGPCYLKTEGISKEQEEDLYKAYLNMAPSQTLKWIESGKGPSESNVEVEGTEPYIVGGHTASGFWVDTGRATTITGLFAAGDVAGGAPQKYVTGALAEGEIAAESAEKYLDRIADISAPAKEAAEDQENPKNQENRAVPGEIFSAYAKHFAVQPGVLSAEQVEEAMQKVMDEYAGGIRTDYRYNESRLKLADEKIAELQKLVGDLPAGDMFDLLHIYEVRERLTVCRVLIAHLLARKETRWHTFGENADHPEQSEEWKKYVNSRYRDGKIEILFREIVTGGSYEHQN